MRTIPNLTAALAVLAMAMSSQPRAGELQLSSEAFTHGDAIPMRYTCEGKDLSPPLHWSGVPRGTRSLALIVSDPDAPRGTWYHWLIYEIPPTLSGLPAGTQPNAVSRAIAHGLNSWQRTGYGGPCPPTGRHRYVFRLYALDRNLELPREPRAAALSQAMRGHVIAEAELIGTYEKRGR